jgi:hypothetical protein
MVKPMAESAGATDRRGQWWVISLRLLVVIGGGYVASSALVAGLARVLPLLGLARSEAVVLASMLGFVIYLLVLILGLARRSLTRFVVELLVTAAIGLLLAFYGGT